MDPDKLLLALSDNQLISADETAEVVEILNSATNTSSNEVSIDEIYSFIVVASRAKLTEATSALEKLLELQDPLTVSLILETLCSEWQLVNDYLEIVCNFALGVPWDYDEDVRHTALKILGEYVRGKTSGKTNCAPLGVQAAQVLELLFSVFDEVGVETWTRRAAYCALLRAAGLEWEELPSESVAITFNEDSEKPISSLRLKVA